MSHKLTGEGDGDTLTLSYADLYLNIAVCMILPGLLAVSSLATLDATAAAPGAQEIEQPAETKVLTYVIGAEGGLELDPNSLAVAEMLAEFGSETQLVAAFPAGAGYGAVTQVLRELGTATSAPINHTEYSE